ncbi:MAG: DUF2721 domain-containing protein [Ktedonobacterales bacterium]
MTAADLARIIQIILAPVVMITSCGIIVGGILSQHAAINDRIRALAHERLDLLTAPDGTLNLSQTMAHPAHAERLSEIDAEIPRLVRRHVLVRNAALALYGAIAILVISMFAIAIAVLQSGPVLRTIALVIFLLGTASALLGIILMAYELRISHDAIHYEVQRMLDLDS